jgi:hypothetical protein
MGLFWAVLTIAGMNLMMAGCGGPVAPLVVGSVSNTVVLADSVTQTRYSLSVSDGAAALTAISGAGIAASEPKLVDVVTDGRYSLEVASGALTLVPIASSAPGATQIKLADTLTAKTYQLAVVRGALTLTPNEGGAQ